MLPRRDRCQEQTLVGPRAGLLQPRAGLLQQKAGLLSETPGGLAQWARRIECEPFRLRVTGTADSVWTNWLTGPGD